MNVGTMDKQLNNLLVYVTLRAGLLSCKGENEVQLVEDLDQKIEKTLEDLGGLSETLRDQMIDNGYILDIKRDISDNLYAYLGHIVESTEIELDGKKHRFFLCHSNEQGFFGASYPNHIQPQNIRVYTIGNITWSESREPVKYDDAPEVLAKLDIDVLAQMKTEGEINYRSQVGRWSNG